MSSVVLNKSLDQPVGPEIAPDTMEKAVGPIESMTTPDTISPFYKREIKFFPITRRLITGSFDGDLSNLSTIGKIFTFITGVFLTLATGLAIAPYILIKNVQIQIFNSYSVPEQALCLIQEKTNDVINAAKAYQGSPDKQAKKQALAAANGALSQCLEQVKAILPELEVAAKSLIRESIQSELGSLLIAIKPRCELDQHRFTVPLASLVLDGFYPTIDGKANPLMKGVSPDTVTYQFEDGIFTPSQDVIVRAFFQQNKLNPFKALADLSDNLAKIKRSSEEDAQAVRSAIKEEIWAKLSNPTSLEFRDFVTAFRKIVIQDKEAPNDEAAALEESRAIRTFTKTLVDQKLLSSSQAEVFIAQVEEGRNATILAEQIKMQRHEDNAVNGLMFAIPMGITAALEYFGYGPLHLLNRLFGEKLNGIASAKGPFLGFVLSGLYTHYQFRHSQYGPKNTKEQFAAKAFADACSLKQLALQQIGTLTSEAFEAIEASQKEEIRNLHIQAEQWIKATGEAFEALAKNPTPQLMDRAINMAVQAETEAEKFAQKAMSLLSFVKK